MENSAAGLFYVNADGILNQPEYEVSELSELMREFFRQPSGNGWNVIFKTSDPKYAETVTVALSNLDQYPKIEFTIKNRSNTALRNSVVSSVKDKVVFSLGWGGIVQDTHRTETAGRLEIGIIIHFVTRYSFTACTLKGIFPCFRKTILNGGNEMVKDFLDTIGKNIDKLSHQVDRNLALTSSRGW
jgi:hypothetical protein